MAMVETAGGFRPNTVTFNSALASSQCLALLSMGGSVCLSTPALVLDALAVPRKAAEWELAARWIEEMRCGHLRPTTMSCNAAISACEKSSRWFSSQFQKREAPDVQSFHLRIRPRRISLELLTDMVSKRSSMDIITINAVMLSEAFA